MKTYSIVLLSIITVVSGSLFVSYPSGTFTETQLTNDMSRYDMCNSGGYVVLQNTGMTDVVTNVSVWFDCSETAWTYFTNKVVRQGTSEFLKLGGMSVLAHNGSNEIIFYATGNFQSNTQTYGLLSKYPSCSFLL